MSSCEIIDAFPAFLSFCRTVRVEPMVVSPPHRFHGIGRALLRRAIEEDKRLDVRYGPERPRVLFLLQRGFSHARQD